MAGGAVGQGAGTGRSRTGADGLEGPVERVRLDIGDSALPQAFPAWGSTGTASWGWAIVDGAQKLRTRLRDEFGGVVPAAGLEADRAFNGNPEPPHFSIHASRPQLPAAPLHQPPP